MKMRIESRVVRMKVVRLGLECTAHELAVLNANLSLILDRSTYSVSAVTRMLANAIDQAHQKALNGAYHVRETEHVNQAQPAPDAELEPKEAS